MKDNFGRAHPNDLVLPHDGSVEDLAGLALGAAALGGLAEPIPQLAGGQKSCTKEIGGNSIRSCFLKHLKPEV